MQKKMTDTYFLISCHLRRNIRAIIGIITGIVGLTDMLSAIVPKFGWIAFLGRWPLETIPYRFHAQTFTVIVGFFLIMLSYGLVRGKRHACCITIVLLLLSSILHVQRSGSVLATVIALSLAVLLYMLSRFFRAKTDPPSAWRGYIALFLGLGIVTFYTIGGFLALYNNFGPLFDRFGVDIVIVHLLTFTHMHIEQNTQAFFFGRAIPILCICAILYGMVQILQPIAAVLLPNYEEHAKVSELAYFHGKNSISYFALGEDKSYFFSASGKLVISYVLQNSTAVVAGDPIGPENELSTAIQQFVTFCSEQDWTLVFWQVRAEIIDLYRKSGLHLLKIGEDAVIHTQNFTLKGGAMANVRSSAKRAEKDGIRVIFYQGQVTDTEQLAQLDHISRKWLSSKGGSEMGFSMGHFDPLGDQQQFYALAIDTTNTVHAFVSFVPIYGRHGWGLDLMRRAEQSAPGTMELLLARAIEHMKADGIEIVSLGLAPLSNANHDSETFLSSSIDTLTGRFGNPAKNQSLFNFKKKFQPKWESRYLVYSDALNLPKIGLALYHAHQADTSLLAMMRKSLRDWQRRQQAQLPTRTTGALEPLNV